MSDFVTETWQRAVDAFMPTSDRLTQDQRDAIYDWLAMSDPTARDGWAEQHEGGAPVSYWIRTEHQVVDTTDTTVVGSYGDGACAEWSVAAMNALPVDPDDGPPRVVIGVEGGAIAMATRSEDGVGAFYVAVADSAQQVGSAMSTVFGIATVGIRLDTDGAYQLARSAVGLSTLRRLVREADNARASGSVPPGYELTTPCVPVTADGLDGTRLRMVLPEPGGNDVALIQATDRNDVQAWVELTPEGADHFGKALAAWAGGRIKARRDDEHEANDDGSPQKTSHSGNTAIAEALAEVVGQPVVGAVWAIGRAMDGVCFVLKQWGSGGGWTSHHASLTDCLTDLMGRVETPTAVVPGPEDHTPAGIDLDQAYRHFMANHHTEQSDQRAAFERSVRPLMRGLTQNQLDKALDGAWKDYAYSPHPGIPDKPHFQRAVLWARRQAS